jgi:FAD/FMN-containing dehydrogenase/Fe-S oxidoreductase
MNDRPEGAVKRQGVMRLFDRLETALEGEVLTSRFDRGRYATDASFYQIMPAGVVLPKSAADIAAVLEIAREEGVTVTARGGGTSQSGQTVGAGLIADCSRHFNRLLSVDEAAQTCEVEPGIVLDELNRQLRPKGLWFPVDVSTATRATIGGMTGNNSCGTRSLRYGIMRDRVLAIDALLAGGEAVRFDAQAAQGRANEPSAGRDLVRDLVDLGRREAATIGSAYPEVSRRVGGYNLDALLPNGAPINPATLLVGSEGTLALSTRITLKLAPIPKHRVQGVCHFPTFRAAMEAPQHIVKLGPTAVELVDRTMIELGRANPLFRAVLDQFIKGEPQAVLITEFAEEDQAENLRRLKALAELMGDLGLPGSVVEIIDPGLQKQIFDVRSSALNIMMSMKSEGKPVSFIEDCAVPLEHLGNYTERLTHVFAKHGTTGTWYAHASVGCLHVRPVLNLKLDKDVRTMRAIAEEAFALVREYKGAHSGEHGDGLVRSEFHEQMYGRPLVALFEEVKDRFDPDSRLNPGKIVRPPKMDDRSLFRFPPGYRVPPIETALDWSGFSGQGGGFQGAVEMCNNNGACRKLQGGVMCPSYRVTRNERDATRGRANTLRLAISGQLGPDALAAPEMLDTLKLCVSCKGCRRECPTGVDMAKMKIEVLNAANSKRRMPLRERMIAKLPHYAPFMAQARGAINLAQKAPGFGILAGAMGFAPQRSLPAWRKPFRSRATAAETGTREVLLFADTFNRYFEPENLEAAEEVLAAGGYRVTVAGDDGARPLCCGRTFLTAGLVDEARREASRMVDALMPAIERGTPVIGLEPSCLLTLRDEFLSLLPGPDTQKLAKQSFLIEEFIARESDNAALRLKLNPNVGTILVHGHCHQKAFSAVSPILSALLLIPGANPDLIETSCCGMAGAFGYNRETYDISVQMAGLDLLPALDRSDWQVPIVADGFSCRHQIRDLSGRRAQHAIQILRKALMHG